METVDSVLRELSKAQSVDSINALDHLFDIHKSEYLPEITDHDRVIRDALTHLSNCRSNLTHILISRLQTISNLQSSIATINPSLTTLTSTITSHGQAFAQLLHVHRMAPAWGAALVECLRRKEYVRVFLQKASEIADILSKFRAQEERRRNNFKGEISRYIPAGLIAGLDDKPPYCEISVSHTKDNLPNISREDIIGFFFFFFF